MAKEIILVRHGKAADHNTYKRDIDRVLTERGVRDGYKVAQKLLNEGIKPDLIITSPAARANHTAFIIARVLGYKTEKLALAQQLYHCAADVFLQEIYALPEKISSVMLVAHNPGVTDIAYELTHGGTTFLPTTGTAVIKYKGIEWKDVGTKAAKDYLIIKPKEL